PGRGASRGSAGGGDLVPGRYGIADGAGHACRLIGQRAAGHVVTVEVPQHPPAAVKEDECRKRTIARGPVDAHGQGTAVAGDGAIDGPRNGRSLGHATLESAARLGDGEGVCRLPPRRLHLVEDGLHLRIERHDDASSRGTMTQSSAQTPRSITASGLISTSRICSRKSATNSERRATVRAAASTSPGSRPRQPPSSVAARVSSGRAGYATPSRGVGFDAYMRAQPTRERVTIRRLGETKAGALHKSGRAPLGEGGPHNEA